MPSAAPHTSQQRLREFWHGGSKGILGRTLHTLRRKTSSDQLTQSHVVLHPRRFCGCVIGFFVCLVVGRPPRWIVLRRLFVDVRLRVVFAFVVKVMPDGVVSFEILPQAPSRKRWVHLLIPVFF